MARILFLFLFISSLLYATTPILKKYSNKQMGFHFNYPSRMLITNELPGYGIRFSSVGSVRKGKINSVPLIVLKTMTENASSNESIFTVSISSASDCIEEWKGELPENHLPHFIIVGNNRFVLNYSSDGAHDTFFQRANYIAQVNGLCWEVQFFSNILSMEGLDSKKKRKADWLDFLRVFQSFTFDER